MKRIAQVAIAAALIAFAVGGCGGTHKTPAPPLPRALTESQLIRAATPAVVHIRTRTKYDQSTGTGFMISPTEILTAAHVVRGGVNLKAKIDGTTQPVRIEGIDVCADQALLTVGTQVPNPRTLPLAPLGPLEPNAHLDLLSFASSAVTDFGHETLSTSPLTVANPNVARPSLGPSFGPLRDLVQVQGDGIAPGSSGAAY